MDPAEIIADAKVPKTLEEFMEQEGLDEWPQRITSENSLLLEADSILGTRDDIKDTLRAAAPSGLEKLDALEARLDRMQTELFAFTDLTLTSQPRESKIRNNMFHVPPQAERMAAESDASMIHKKHLAKKQKRRFGVETGDNKSKSIDSIRFPGFYAGEMLELPGQYEAPILMNAVTLRQHFNPGFLKLWKKVFLSEASVMIMQDLFWWVFLDRYQSQGKSLEDMTMQEKDEELKQIEDAKDRLFNRIASCFVTLFFSIHPDIKDKFLNVYPNSLAQTVYAAFVECFPMSKVLFDIKFKNYVANLCFQWIAGVKPAAGCVGQWDVEKLMSNAGGGGGGSSIESDKRRDSGLPPVLMSEEKKAEAEFADFMKTEQEVTIVRGIPKAVPPPPHQSLPVEGSDQMERVRFSVHGRSPLVSHWLSRQELGRAKKAAGSTNMVRTQIKKQNDEGVTYAEVIEEVKKNARTRKKEYKRIENETKQEIRRIDINLKRQLDQLNVLEQQLLGTGGRGADTNRTSNNNPDSLTQ